MLAFKYIPGNLRLPGTRAEVQPGQNSLLQDTAKGLLIGQLLATGSKVTTVATSAATSSGATLTFTNAAAIQNVVPGPYLLAIDRTTVSAIPAGTTVVSKSAGTVTLSGTATGVLSGDSIQFIDITPTWSNSQTNMAALYGPGSQIARMDAQRRANDPFGEWYIMPLPDDPQSVAATGSIVFSGTATAAGVIALYIGGVSVPVAVTSGMTAAQAATAIAAAVNANTNLAVTASASSGTATFTAKNAGQTGDDIDLRINFFGAQNNEFMPAGLVATGTSAEGTAILAAMTGGATNPYAQMVLSFSSLPKKKWGAIAFPYANDTNAFNDMATFCGDVSGLWEWAQMKYGLAFGAIRGTLGANETMQASRNDPHISVVPSTNAGSPSDEWSAGVAGYMLALQRAQPGANSNNGALQGIVGPSQADAYQDSDREALLFSGGSTFTVDALGNVTLEKLITTYQTNSFGNPDSTFLQVDDMYRIAFALTYLKQQTDQYIAGARFADDGQRFGPGIKVITPSLMTQFQGAQYQNLINMAICEDLASFMAGLYCAFNPENSKRMDIQWPGIIVGDADIVAILAQPSTSGAPIALAA